jgi:hypothetical protein
MLLQANWRTTAAAAEWLPVMLLTGGGLATEGQGSCYRSGPNDVGSSLRRPVLLDAAAGVAPCSGHGCYMRRSALLPAAAGVASSGGWYCSLRRSALLHATVNISPRGGRRCSIRRTPLLHAMDIVATCGGHRCSLRRQVLLHAAAGVAAKERVTRVQRTQPVTSSVLSSREVERAAVARSISVGWS